MLAEADVEVGLVGGVAFAAEEGIDAKCGVLVRVLDAQVGAGGAQVGVGDLQSLVGGGDLRLEGVEAVVVEDGPPVAAGDGVLGLGGLPVGVLFEGAGVGAGIELFEGGRGGDGGRFVFGSDHAAGECEGRR